VTEDAQAFLRGIAVGTLQGDTMIAVAQGLGYYGLGRSAEGAAVLRRGSDL